jgi:hypothetical protein
MSIQAGLTRPTQLRRAPHRAPTTHTPHDARHGAAQRRACARWAVATAAPRGRGLVLTDRAGAAPALPPPPRPLHAQAHAHQGPQAVAASPAPGPSVNTGTSCATLQQMAQAVRAGAGGVLALAQHDV